MKAVMPRIGFATFLSFLIIFESAIAQVGTNATYWIAFYDEPTQEKGLLRIDALGNILTAPTPVVARHFWGPGGSGVAMQNGPNNSLLMWIIGRRDALGRYNTLLRAKIDKRSLSMSAISKLKYKSSSIIDIQVSQKAQNNFMSLERLQNGDQHVLTRVSISEAGKFIGSPHPISSQDLGDSCYGSGSCGGGISADGRIAFLISRPNFDTTQLFLQRLDSKGMPNGDAQLIEELINTAGGIWSADISNELKGDVRFLVYVWSPQPTCCERSNRLYLQRIDSKTGKKLGSRVLLYKYLTIEGGQSVAIDPDGKFVIYGISDPASGRFNGQNVLVFQSLDATGHKSGRLKLLARQVLPGIDILKDE